MSGAVSLLLSKYGLESMSGCLAGAVSTSQAVELLVSKMKNKRGVVPTKEDQITTFLWCIFMYDFEVNHILTGFTKEDVKHQFDIRIKNNGLLTLKKAKFGDDSELGGSTLSDSEAASESDSESEISIDEAVTKKQKV